MQTPFALASHLQFAARRAHCCAMNKLWGLWAMAASFVMWGCNPPPLAAGGRQTCVTEDGRVRCWGAGQYGVLGYGNTTNIGDNETPASAGDVSVGAAVDVLAPGYYHTCALTSAGNVRCWGRNDLGQLGLGNTTNIGDNELPSSVGNVVLGGTATQISSGIYHTCALLTTGAVHCWGGNMSGQLGYGHTNAIGDNETPASAGAVPIAVSDRAVEIAAGEFHTCARLDSGAVKCWGYNAYGTLGYGHTSTIGDNETPLTVGNVNVGGTVTALAAGEGHTCALLSGGQVRCWGYAAYGQLGYANTTNIGDNETPASVGTVNFGSVTALTISAGGNRTCVLDSDYNVRCWGEGLGGGLGYGNQNSIGDNEHPVTAGTVSIGGLAVSISVGYDHTCSVVSASGYQVRCWGRNAGGKLGYGHTSNIGDNELPSSQPFAVVE